MGQPRRVTLTKETCSTHVDLTVDGETEIEIEIFSSDVVKVEEVKPEEVITDVQIRPTSTQRVSRDKEDVQIKEADGISQGDTACDKKNPRTPEG